MTDCDIDHSENGEREMTEDNGLPCKIDPTELSKDQLVALWVDRDGDLISIVGKVHSIRRDDDGTPKAVTILPYDDNLLKTWVLGDDDEGTIVLLRDAVQEPPKPEDSPILAKTMKSRLVAGGVAVWEESLGRWHNTTGQWFHSEDVRTWVRLIEEQDDE